MIEKKCKTARLDRKKTKFSFLGIYSVAVYIFLYIPLLVVIFYSFSATKSIVYFDRFSMDWYKALIEDRTLLQTTLHSVQVGLIATSISIIVGTSGGFFLARAKIKGKEVFATLCQLPLVLPGIIMGLALLVFFMSLNIKLSMFTILLAHTAFTTPVVMFQVASRLQRLGFTYEDAAKDLGANSFKTFFLVILPMIKTAIIGGGLLAFTLSFDEIIITFFVTGTWVTLPVYLYSLLRFGLTPQVFAISTIILFFSIVIIFFVAKFTEVKSERVQR